MTFLKFLLTKLQTRWFCSGSLQGSHTKWVPCYHSMALPQIVGREDELQIWRVAADMLNKQLPTADKDWPYSLHVGRSVGLATAHNKTTNCCKITRTFGTHKSMNFFNRLAGSTNNVRLSTTDSHSWSVKRPIYRSFCQSFSQLVCSASEAVKWLVDRSIRWSVGYPVGQSGLAACQVLCDGTRARASYLWYVSYYKGWFKRPSVPVRTTIGSEQWFKSPRAQILRTRRTRFVCDTVVITGPRDFWITL
jgi:hypothetical protein